MFQTMDLGLRAFQHKALRKVLYLDNQPIRFQKAGSSVSIL